MITAENFTEKINLLAEASIAYENGESMLTDMEYDELLDQVGAFTADNPEFLSDEVKVLLGVSGVTVVDVSDKTVAHSVPMLSLDKANSVDDLQGFYDRLVRVGETGFKVQLKLDGISLAARYSQGRLVGLATRGAGHIGKDVSYLIDSTEVSIVGLPVSVNVLDDFELRGELFATNSQFVRVSRNRFNVVGEEFSHSRNAVSGIVKKADKGLGYSAELTFCVFAVIQNEVYVDNVDVSAGGVLFADDYINNQLMSSGVNDIVLNGIESFDGLLSTVNRLGDARVNLDALTDGVVVKPVSEVRFLNELGFNSHHPYSQVAFKYPGALKQTTITGIEVTVGKTGKLTPVAVFNEVVIDNIRINRATLHNFDWLTARAIRVGSKVMVQRANDVIPKIASLVQNPTDTTPYTQPDICPACAGSVTVNGAYLLCVNSECGAMLLASLITAVGSDRLDIDGLSASTVEALFDAGYVRNLADFYKLTIPILTDLPIGGSKQDGTPRVLGAKRAKTIFDSIETSKTRGLDKILASLNVKGLGRTQSRWLKNTFHDIDTVLAASVTDFASVDGIGEVTATEIWEGLQKKRNLIEELKTFDVDLGNSDTLTINEEAATGGANKLFGAVISLSGDVPEGYRNRGAFVDYITSQGAEFVSSPNNRTTLFIGDATSTSTKTRKAVSLGVEIVHPSEWENWFNSSN